MEELRSSLAREGVSLVKANKHHAKEIARIMRTKDEAELRANGGTDPAAIARASINRSCESWAAYLGSDLLCVFGVRAHQGFHIIWAMTSTYVDRHQKVFYRASRVAVEHLRGKYPVMFNMIHCKYPEALRWVERLGFKLAPPDRHGPLGDLFCCAVLETRSLVEVAHV